MKTVVIGLGTQRAGTTFLSKLLDSHQHCCSPLIKELHIWSSNEIKLFPERKMTKENINLYNNQKLQSVIKNNPQRLRGNMLLRSFRFDLQTNTNNYFLYFKELLENNNCNLSYDITPQYIGIKKETLQAIYNGFKKINIRCKFILLLRDPVKRSWSSVKRHFLHKNRFQFDKHITSNIREGVDLRLNLQDAFLKYAHSEYSYFFNNYQQILENLKCFNPEDYSVLFYENLRENIFQSSLENFLNAKFSNVDFNKKINESTKDKISEDLMKKITPLYSKTYEYCGKKYSDTLHIWSGFKYI